MINRKYFNICFVVCMFIYSVNAHALTYLFSHGLFDSEIQAYRYTKEYQSVFGYTKNNPFYLMDGAVKTFSFPDVIGLFSKMPFLSKIPYIFRTSFGQNNEINALRNTYNEIDDEIVLVSVSRGASAASIFMGLDKPERVKAVILISPFDHVKNVFEYHTITWLISKMACCDKKKVYEWLNVVTSFNPNGMHPIDYIEDIDNNIPVLFVCTKTDTTVPYWSTVNLYNRLVDSGHEKTHLLVLNSGKHAKLLQSQEAEIFQNVVHAFYQTYNLPCNELFAELGAEDFSGC